MLLIILLAIDLNVKQQLSTGLGNKRVICLFLFLIPSFKSIRIAICKGLKGFPWALTASCRNIHSSRIVLPSIQIPRHPDVRRRVLQSRKLSNPELSRDDGKEWSTDSIENAGNCMQLLLPKGILGSHFLAFILLWEFQNSGLFSFCAENGPNQGIV